MSVISAFALIVVITGPAECSGTATRLAKVIVPVSGMVSDSGVVGVKANKVSQVINAATSTAR